MDKNIGFIGAGNMGSAIIGGLIDKSIVKASQIYVVSQHQYKTQATAEKFGINAAINIEKLTIASDILIVAVKPKVVAKVLLEALPFIKKNTVIVSIAAGVTLASLEAILGVDKKIIRIMPNLPSIVGEGVSSITPNTKVKETDLDDIKAIFNSLGKAQIVSEDLIHAVVGVSGSSPAYVFMFIEALADAAVQGGMPREQAYTFAAQSVLGSAKMMLETGTHPGILKDMICSAGGTTIEAVCELERKGFRAAIIDAARSAMTKSQEMSNKK